MKALNLVFWHTAVTNTIDQQTEGKGSLQWKKGTIFDMVILWGCCLKFTFIYQRVTLCLNGAIYTIPEISNGPQEIGHLFCAVNIYFA